MSDSERRAVGGWLIALWVLVLLMVMIGGVTRLTGSGLSIVEWKPVSGILPPLSEQAWQDTFNAYQSSPQFHHQNSWMALEDFKRIFFWEYLHRLFGRLIGLAFFVPWLVFVMRGTLKGAWVWRTFGLMVLGGLQGALGWFMVMSGLVNEPRVSHYRLAAHLLLGIGVGQAILWQALEVASPRLASNVLPRAQRWLALGLLPLLALQITYGAFMGGLRAGWVAATFPDMNGHYAPGYFFTSGSIWQNLFDNPLSIHYLHRVIGFVVLAYAGATWWALRKQGGDVRFASHAFLAAIFGQIALGAMTVMLGVPVPVAVAHQGGAYIVTAAAVVLCHLALGARAGSARAQTTDVDGGPSDDPTLDPHSPRTARLLP
ncbi:MAG TPA: COX15/CtaA family protein [Polyangiales bacterium]|nr:COX15/CtaA family protein [Polyangiales bacterium]